MNNQKLDLTAACHTKPAHTLRAHQQVYQLRELPLSCWHTSLSQFRLLAPSLQMVFCPYVGAAMPTQPGLCLHAALLMSVAGFTHLQVQHVCAPPPLEGVMMVAGCVLGAMMVVGCSGVMTVPAGCTMTCWGWVGW